MQNWLTLSPALLVLFASLGGCGGSSGTSPSPATPSPSVAPPASTTHPARVEPTNRLTFGPNGFTPAGTVFYISVVTKSDTTRFRLELCGVPCNTASDVKIWQPENYAAGEELSWRVEVGGQYYQWGQNVSTNRSETAVSDELRGTKLRITFDSGSVIDAWYTTP
jgi:hypothetical protein